MDTDTLTPASVPVPASQPPQNPAPVTVVKGETLQRLGENLSRQFDSYKSNRRMAELQWLKNLRQYLGVYDPEILSQLSPKRSKAYPKITRVKVISVLSRIMNLMFPGNERNWELNASPNAEMAPEDVQAAVEKWMKQNQEAGVQVELDEEMLDQAIQNLADERARKVSRLIDDQLQELGGDQTLDHVLLNRKVLLSGVMYGVGVLRGPFVREVKRTKWQLVGGRVQPVVTTAYKPQFEHLPVWDFYPDMSAKSFYNMDGYYVRLVMTRTDFRQLAERTGFMPQQIKKFLRENPRGNYKQETFETELRSLGVKELVNFQSGDQNKYEVVIWHGVVSGQDLADCGAKVPPDQLQDDIEAEVWMVGNTVIKADINAWRKLGRSVRTIHCFSFDEDDTSIFGNGLPAVVRDSQLAICAATRMLMDNASVVCGPNMEINVDLLQPNQDIIDVHAYKNWYRTGDDITSQYPALRNIQIDSHLGELLKIIELFMNYMDVETFVGPQTGGDMSKGPSEPFRTAAGASMLRGDAALPFKDIVRNFDAFTQSYIYSLVQFNRTFNPSLAPAGDYDVVARGATSLIAKEVRGIQLDNLATTLTAEDRDHIDERKFVEMRFKARDLEGALVTPDEAKRRKAGRSQAAQMQQEMQKQLSDAQVRDLLSGAFKNMTQGQKNLSQAELSKVQAALDVLTNGMENVIAATEAENPEPRSGSAEG